ncbi:MAG: hypothetical protein U5R14_12020 [Gemmatimonadota bacterium]|nr:hypothetical protein [Gemmatimonadota bacterium]
MRPMTSILAVTALFFATDDVQAQEAHASDYEAELREMVAEPDPAERDREVVRDFLDRSDVADVVAEHGLDRERLEAGVSTLDADAAADLARQVRSMGEEAELVGGNTVVLSTSTIVIILLILILVT